MATKAAIFKNILYFRAINAGKSVRNEDQGTSVRGVLYTTAAVSVKQDPVPETKTNLLVENNIDSSKESTDVASEVQSSESNGIKENVNILVNSNAPDDPKFTTPPSTPEVQRKVVVSIKNNFIYYNNKLIMEIQLVTFF